MDYDIATLLRSTDPLDHARAARLARRAGPLKDPRRPLRIRERTTPRRLGRALERALRLAGLAPEEYFSVQDAGRALNQDVPFLAQRYPWRWLAIFPVQGQNEGWYVHVDGIISATGRGTPRERFPEVVNVFLAKTYSKASALGIAARLCELLADVI